MILNPSLTTIHPNPHQGPTDVGQLDDYERLRQLMQPGGYQPSPEWMSQPSGGYQPAPEWLQQLMRPGQGPAIGPVAPMDMVTPDVPYVPQPLQMWLPAGENEQGARNLLPGMMEPLQQGNPNIPVKWVDNPNVNIGSGYVKDILPADHPLLKDYPHMGMIPVHMVNQLAQFEGNDVAANYSRANNLIRIKKDKAVPTNFFHELQHAINMQLLGSEMPKDVPNSMEEMMALTNNVVFPSGNKGAPTARLKAARRVLMQYQLDRDTQGEPI